MSSANFILSTLTQRVQRDPGFRRSSTAGSARPTMVSTELNRRNSPCTGVSTELNRRSDSSIDGFDKLNHQLGPTADMAQRRRRPSCCAGDAVDSSVERQRAILGHSFDGAAASAAERSFMVCDTIAAMAFTHTLIICRIAFTRAMTSLAATAVPTGTAQIL